ncbi:MAG TPA: amidase, partial [Marinobacter hydrocarbonoclasticus]|nr:amidase [Marinobacter nauticus]
MNQPPSTRFHCFRNDAMADNDATALAERIRSGEVSAQEVTAAAIERAQLAAPVINGVVAERYQPALTQSQRPDAQTGRFVGVPTYIK